ncbi:MAG: TonB-dependent receptor [Bacteroidaceae bacterium]|nr:TonB-dependent receptor [Bacteroidaceae bacterium]
MNKRIIMLAGIALPVICAQAQVEQTESEYELEGLEVIGTRVPLSPQHSVRMVQVLTRQQIAATAAQSVNDLLKLVAGVDVRQRGAYGVQTDIGVNGGTSDQLTVLLNGVNISNSHTGHLTMDLPVSVDDIERIEVLEGGASRVYGSSAFSGAINIVTRHSQDDNLGVSLSGGSFGTAAAGAHLNLGNRQVFNRFSGGYARSDGGSDNSDFNKGNFFMNGGYNSSDVDIKWQAGVSTMNYGANTFYSAAYNNQYEDNRRYMAAISAETKGRVHLMPSLYWNRSLDHYLLFRDNPSAYENFHQLNVYGANLNAYVDWSLGKTAFGAEVRSEGILSNNLGKPMEESEYVKVPGHPSHYTNSDNRTNISYFLEHDLLWDNVTVSLGLLANMNSALDYRFRLYPGVDISWRPAGGWKLYASFNQALRMPTFTDLYYKSPTINGNVGLKPEKSTDYTVGAQYSSPAFQAKVKAFYRRGTDMIDWVKFNAEDSYHSANFNLNNYGVELSSTVNFQEMWGANSFLKQLNVSYAYIYQSRRDDKTIYRSNYALDYLKNKLVVSLNHRVAGKLEAQWDVRVQHRNGSFELYTAGKPSGTLTPYGTVGLLDLKLQWVEKTYSLYVQGNNLTNHKYYDLGNVQQPGFWFMAGVKKMFAL